MSSPHELEEEAVGEEALRKEEDIIRRRKLKDKENANGNDDKNIEINPPFGEKIPFKSFLESDAPKPPLRPDDPMFSNLSVIKNDEYLLKMTKYSNSVLPYH